MPTFPVVPFHNGGSFISSSSRNSNPRGLSGCSDEPLLPSGPGFVCQGIQFRGTTFDVASDGDIDSHAGAANGEYVLLLNVPDVPTPPPVPTQCGGMLTGVSARLVQWDEASGTWWSITVLDNYMFYDTAGKDVMVVDVAASTTVPWTQMRLFGQGEQVLDCEHKTFLQYIDGEFVVCCDFTPDPPGDVEDHNIGDHTDVETSFVQHGDVLVYDSVTKKWVASPPPCGCDTGVGGGATTAAVAQLTDVQDVSVTTGLVPQDGDVLRYATGDASWQTIPAAALPLAAVVDAAASAALPALADANKRYVIFDVLTETVGFLAA
jgi:hypothetical protein